MAKNPNLVDVHVGKKLRQARKHAGLSQTAFLVWVATAALGAGAPNMFLVAYECNNDGVACDPADATACSGTPADCFTDPSGHTDGRNEVVQASVGDQVVFDVFFSGSKGTVVRSFQTWFDRFEGGAFHARVARGPRKRTACR